MPYRPDRRSLDYLSQSGPTAGELRGRATKRDLEIWEQERKEFEKHQRQVNPKELPPNVGGFIAPTHKQLLRADRLAAGKKEVARQEAEKKSKVGVIRQAQAKARNEMTKLKWRNK